MSNYDNFKEQIDLSLRVMLENDSRTGKSPAKSNTDKLDQFFNGLEVVEEDYVQTKEVRGKHIEIFKNPSRKELAKLSKETDNIRCYLLNNDMVIWSGDAIHNDIAPDNKKIIPLFLYIDNATIIGVDVTDYSKRTKWYRQTETKDAIINHPEIKRLANGEEESEDFVSYFDEAIVGPWHEDLTEAVVPHTSDPNVLKHWAGRRKAHQKATQKRLAGVQRAISDLEDNLTPEQKEKLEKIKLLHVLTPEKKAAALEVLKNLDKDHKKKKTGKDYNIVVGSFKRSADNFVPHPDVFYNLDNYITFVYDKGTGKYADSANGDYGKIHRYIVREMMSRGESNKKIMRLAKEQEGKDEDDKIKVHNEVILRPYDYGLVLGRYHDEKISFWSNEDEKTIDKSVKLFQQHNGNPEVKVVYIPEENVDRGTFTSKTTPVLEPEEPEEPEFNTPDHIFDDAKVEDAARVYGNAEVRDKAIVSDNAKVFEGAKVLNYAQVSDHARVYGDAMIQDRARVFGEAKVFGNAEIMQFAQIAGRASVNSNVVVGGAAKIYGESFVSGRASITDRAVVNGDSTVTESAFVHKNALITDNAIVQGESFISGNAKVGGNAVVGQKCRIYGDAMVYGSCSVLGNTILSGDAEINKGRIMSGEFGSKQECIDAGYFDESIKHNFKKSD